MGELKAPSTWRFWAGRESEVTGFSVGASSRFGKPVSKAAAVWLALASVGYGTHALDLCHWRIDPTARTGECTHM
ncbi:hypothetical protein TIFTF001_029815 [Ficus carica]|uniref:Uncharacterized protein n=1 Tax=Ficus carica TaxID=3494 RepID=A0AA88J2X4_FICCA|nr:hypothetical protein TIFTF001_029815 [Ficus carica]